MTIERWTPTEFLDKVREHAEREFPAEYATERGQWLASVEQLLERAHSRGDGVAVYENADLGHPEIGQWQVTSYGSEASQLVTDSIGYRPDGPGSAQRLIGLAQFGGKGYIPKTLPDIGGRVNWRYELKAVVPAVRL